MLFNCKPSFSANHRRLRSVFAPTTSNLRRFPMPETPEKIQKTDAEWRATLTPEQYHVLREKGTERPFTGPLEFNYETGDYHCAGCGALLFNSGAKFDSGCGWPSFMIPPDSPAVQEHEHPTFAMPPVEVTCPRCPGHLRPPFPHRPPPP